MTTLICGYRIYPTWFHCASMEQPMAELAHGAAADMGRRVLFIGTTDQGVDFRGSFIDFRVAYSSTDSGGDDMVDAGKYPKAARLQEQREEKYKIEQARLKLEAEEKAKISVKQRTKTQHDQCKAAEAKIAAKAKGE